MGMEARPGAEDYSAAIAPTPFMAVASGSTRHSVLTDIYTTTQDMGRMSGLIRTAGGISRSVQTSSDPLRIMLRMRRVARSTLFPSNPKAEKVRADLPTSLRSPFDWLGSELLQDRGNEDSTNDLDDRFNGVIR